MERPPLIRNQWVIPTLGDLMRMFSTDGQLYTPIPPILAQSVDEPVSPTSSVSEFDINAAVESESDEEFDLNYNTVGFTLDRLLIEQDVAEGDHNST